MQGRRTKISKKWAKHTLPYLEELRQNYIDKTRSSRCPLCVASDEWYKTHKKDFSGTCGFACAWYVLDNRGCYEDANELGESKYKSFSDCSIKQNIARIDDWIKQCKEAGQ